MKTTQVQIEQVSNPGAATNGMRKIHAAYAVLVGGVTVGRISNAGCGWVVRDYRTGSTVVVFRASTLKGAKEHARTYFV